MKQSKLINDHYHVISSPSSGHQGVAIGIKKDDNLHSFLPILEELHSPHIIAANVRFKKNNKIASLNIISYYC